MASRAIRTILCGMGNVNRSFVEILASHQQSLEERYGARFVIVGATDSGGAAIDARGLSVQQLIDCKLAKRSVASLERVGHAGLDGVQVMERLLHEPESEGEQARVDLVLEATPVVKAREGRLQQPALDTIRYAVKHGVPCVLANKGPLAFEYQSLMQLAREHQTKIRFSACVGGALPTIDIGRRDLVGCHIQRVEAVLNGTTHSMLRAIESGVAYDEALRDAQRRGIAETDPSLDVDGWDAAFKLVIVANAVLNQPSTLHDVDVQGITNVTVADLQAATSRQERVVLLCSATKNQSPAASPERHWNLSVKPTPLPIDHPLARMHADEMGVVYHTDIAGIASATTLERGPKPTAAAMLRDALHILCPQVIE
mgnify:FL=1